MTILVTVLLGALGSMLASEVTDISQAITRRLLAGAARRLPNDHKNRYIDEWNGDLDYLRTTRGKLAILFWAIGVYLSSYRLAAAIAASTPTRDIPTISADDADVTPAADTANIASSVLAAARPVWRMEMIGSFENSLLHLAENRTLFELAKSMAISAWRDPYRGELVQINGEAIRMIHSHIPNGTSWLTLVYMIHNHDRIVTPLVAFRRANEPLPDDQRNAETSSLALLRQQLSAPSRTHSH